MEIKSFSDKVLLPTKRDVLRVHLYFKLLENNIRPFENDMDIILELYFYNGYHNSDEQASFIKVCIDKKYRKSDQSLRNALSKYAKLGVFTKPKNTVLHVSDDYIPQVKNDRLILQHIISHAK